MNNGKGKLSSSEATKSILIRSVPVNKYRHLKGIIQIRYGMGVSSWFRKMIDRELKKDKKNDGYKKEST